jgi:hypothetical protein
MLLMPDARRLAALEIPGWRLFCATKFAACPATPPEFRRYLVT